MVFLPLWDLDNPLRRTKHAYVTWALIAVNVGVFYVVQSGAVINAESGEVLTLLFGAIPVEITSDRQILPDAHFFPEGLTLFTYMFLHGGWLHLGGNMLFLWVFGDNVEDALGHRRYLLFYVACGVIGGLCQVLVDHAGEHPVVGASAAVAGVLGAYLILYPKVQVWILLFNRFPVKLAAGYALGSWGGTQVIAVLLQPTSNVAWWGHIGGMLCGILLVYAMRPRAETIVVAAGPTMIRTGASDPVGFIPYWWRGRLQRLPFVYWIVLLDGVGEIVQWFYPEVFKPDAFHPALILMAAIGWMGICATVMRVRDTGLSGWFALLVLGVETGFTLALDGKLPVPENLQGYFTSVPIEIGLALIPANYFTRRAAAPAPA